MDPLDQITLTSHVWGTDKDRAYYLRKIDTLQNGYTILAIESVARSIDAFMENMIDQSDEGYVGLKPSVKQILWTQGLDLWLEFSEGHLLHWCEFMNESLINILFLGVKVYFHSLNHHHYTVRGIKGRTLAPSQIQVDRLGMLLRYTVSSFFENHDHDEYINGVRYPQINFNHVFGLPAFYRLNILKNYALNPTQESVVVKVPDWKDGVEYKNTADFVQIWERWSESYWKHMVKPSLEEANERGEHQFAIREPRFMLMPLFRRTDLGNGTVQNVGLNPFIKEMKRWSKRGYHMFRRMVTINAHSPHLKDTPVNNWCKMMNDELIHQVYVTANTVLFVTNFYLPTPEHITEEYIVEFMIYPQISQTCQMFFEINKNSQQIEAKEDRGIDWSGHWGMPMFSKKNFKRIEPPPTGGYSDDSEEEDEADYNYPFPYPVMPLSECMREVGLNLGFLTLRGMLRENASDAMVGRHQDDLAEIISQVYLNEMEHIDLSRDS